MVTIHAVLILSAWTVANRQTVRLVRLKEHVAARPEPAGYREPAARRLALAYALALLESGDPPADGYSCGVEINADPGTDDAEALTYVLTFNLADPANGHWSVTLAPYDPGIHPLKGNLPWPWHF
jgi:hypothetical protein